MDKKLPGRLRHIEIVLKELIDGKQSLLIQSINGILFKYLLEKHLTHRGGQLVNEPSNPQVLIVNDGPLGVEHLTHVNGHLGLLVGPG